MSDLNLNLRIRTNDDGTTTVFNATGKSIGKLRDDAENANRSLKGMEQSSQQAAQTLRTLAGIAATALGGLSFGKAVTEIGSFETAMINVKALTMASGEEMARLSAQARELGASTSFNAQQAAEAQGVLASAGLKTNEILTATPAVLQLAAAGALSLKDAADIATGAMSGLGLSLGDLPRINDVLVKTAADTKTSVADLGAAMQVSAPISKAFGISLEELSAAMGILAQNNIKGSEAGNNFKSMLVALGNDTKENTAILQAHGLTYKDLDVQARGLLPVLESLGNAHLSGAEALKIFGSDAAAAGLALSSSSSDVAKLTEELKKAKGAAGIMSAILNTGLEKELNALYRSVSELILQLGDAGLKGALSDIVNTATGVISVYTGMLDKFSESNKLTAEQTGNLRSLAESFYNTVAPTLAVVGAVLALNGALKGFEIAIGIAAAAARINPFVGLMASLGALISLTYTAKAGLLSLNNASSKMASIDSQIAHEQQKARLMNKEGFIGRAIDTIAGNSVEGSVEKLDKLYNARIKLRQEIDKSSTSFKTDADASAKSAVAAAKAAGAASGLAAAHHGAGNAAKAAGAAHHGAAGHVGQHASAVKQLSDIDREAARLTEAMATPQQKFNAEVNKATSLYNSGKISLETYIAALAKYRDELDNSTSATKRQEEQWKALVDEANQRYDLKASLAESETTAQMAEQFKLAGFTTEEIKKQLDIQKQYASDAKANPLLDASEVEAYTTKRLASEARIAEASAESANAYGKAWDQAIKNIQDSFGNGIKGILTGEATASFEAFANNVKDTLYTALSQAISASIIDSFNKQDWGGFFSGLFAVGVSYIGSWLMDDGKADPPSAAQKVNNSEVLGAGQMALADSSGRKIFEQTSINSIRAWNTAVDTATQYMRDNASTLWDISTNYLGKISTSLLGDNFVKNIGLLGDGIKSVYSSFSNFGNELIDGVSGIIKNVGQQSLDALGINLSSLVGGAISGAVPSTLTATISQAITPAMTSAITSASSTAATAAAGTISTQVVNAFAGAAQGGLTTAINAAITPAFQSATGAAISASAGAATASTGAVSGALSALGKVAGPAAIVLNMVKLGFDLATIAGNDHATTMTKVSQALDAASLTALSLAAIPIVGWVATIVAAVLKVASAFTSTLENGFNDRNISALFGGHLGEMLFTKSPSATVLTGNIGNDPKAKLSADGSYYTSGDKNDESGAVGIKDAFGYMYARLNDIPNNVQITIQDAVDTFLPMLKTVQAFNNALATSIDVTDMLNNQTALTMDAFFRLGFTAEQEQSLSGLNSANMVVFRMNAIADNLEKTGTKAGEAVNTWWDAFTEKLIKPSPGNQNAEYNATTAFNIEAFIAAELPKLAELPKTLAKLFVDNVVGVADGATQDEFVGQMNDFFAGWTTAKEGLSALGIDIAQSAIPQYLTSLVGLGMTVLESSQALVGFAATFKGAGENITAEFTKAFNKIFDDAKALGQDKQHTSGYISSYVTLSNTASELGLTATAAELDNLATALNATADKSLLAANAVVDKAIAEANLTGVTRDNAIEQLVLTGALTKEQAAATSFSKALVEAQQTMFGGIELAKQQAVFFGTTLSNMGLSFSQVANIGQNVTLAFKDLAEEMAFFDSVAKAVMSESDYAAGKKAQAQATFNSSAQALGLDGYTIDQFKGYAGLGGKYQSDVLAAQAAGDTGRLNSLKNMGSAAITLTEAEKNYTQAVTTASKATDDAADKAKKLADLQKQVDDELRTMGMPDFAKGLDDIKQKIADLAAQAQEAGGSIKNLTQLQNGLIVEYLKTFTDPITKAFNDIGKTDMQQSIDKIKQDLKDTIANISEAAKQGLASQKDVNVYTGQATINAMSQARDVFKPLVDEFNNLGKSDYKKSLEAISQWHDEALRSVNDIAAAYGITTKEAIGWINKIEAARTEALQKELNATIKKSALDEKRAQEQFNQRNSPDVASLSGTLNGIIDSYSQTILTMAASGATLKQMMPTYNAALASGARATQLAIESVAKAYAQVYKQINDVNNTIDDKILTLQGGDVAGAQKQRALADLQSEDLNTQLEGVNKLISLNEQKFQNEIKIATYLNNLMLSAASPLSNVQKRDLAKTQYEKNLAGAKANDQTSIDNLGSSFDTYLEQQKSLSSSSVDYARVFQKGLAQMGELAGGGKGTLEQKSKQATIDQVNELKNLQKILTGTNGILSQQQAKQSGVEASLMSAAEAAKTAFDAILLADKGVKDALGTEATPTIYDGFIQQISESLKAAGFSNTQIASITDALSGVAQSLTTMLSNKVASADTISRAEGFIGNFVNGIGNLLDKSLIDNNHASVISKSVLNTFKGFTDLLNNHLITEPQYNSILGNETQFLTLINTALSNATISQDDATRLIVSRNGLTDNIATALANGTIDPVQAGNIYTLRETAFTNLGAFLANAHLTPANQSLVISGFSTMAANTGLVLKSQGMTPEQIGLISLGFGAAASNANLDLNKLGLTKEQKDLFNMGVSTFSLNVKDGVGGITAGQTALDLINGGVNNLATNMFTGLSSVEWLTPAANIVQGGVNTLATNIANFLASVTPTNTAPANNPAQTAINNTAAVIAQFDALIKAGDYLGAASYGKGAGYDASDMALRASQIGVGIYEDNLTFLKQNGFAKGGVTNKPSIFGEDGWEAAVPLPDGRSIPVTLRNNNSNDEVVTELKELKAQNAKIQEENRQLNIKMTIYLKKLSDLAEKTDAIGTPPVRVD